MTCAGTARRRRSARPGDPADRGSATVLTVAATTLVVLAAFLACSFGAALVAHQRAASVADLAALAGAAAASRADDPCAAADRVVAASAARLVSCRTRGFVVDVDVGLPVSLWRLGRVEVPGRARAGPSDNLR